MLYVGQAQDLGSFSHSTTLLSAEHERRDRAAGFFRIHVSVITLSTLWRAPSVKRVAVNRYRRKAGTFVLLYVLPASPTKREPPSGLENRLPLLQLRVRGQWLEAPWPQARQPQGPNVPGFERATGRRSR